MKRSWLFVGFILAAFAVVLALHFAGVRFGYGGYYFNGKVTLFASKMDTYADYKMASDHEWGHHVYETMFEKGDLLLWKKAVDACGKLYNTKFEGSNAPLYFSSSVKYEEEFADSYSAVKNGVVVCVLKSDFVKKFG